jgi:hypothetical protein
VIVIVTVIVIVPVIVAVHVHGNETVEVIDLPLTILRVSEVGSDHDQGLVPVHVHGHDHGLDHVNVCDHDHDHGAIVPPVVENL